ncbi:MAG: YigZ family protein [Saprospiraceae bacterium]|nr:YigZ family protein [Saprospiraceae bacterium]
MTHQTIQNPTSGLYREKGSKFIAYAIPVTSVEDCHDQLVQIKDDHPKARHWCFAYQVGEKGQWSRSSDDGEPSGTAGRPIARQIESFAVTNVLVVVVRYFGGKLLGTAGLINAYRSSAQDALMRAIIVEKEVRVTFTIRFEYKVMGVLMEALKKRKEIIMQEKVLDEQPLIKISLVADQAETLMIEVIKEVTGLHEADITKPWRFPGLDVDTDFSTSS